MDDQHDKRKQQQHMILREFISSEQSYCASLKQIVDVYMHELRTPSTLERLGMSEDVLPVLFANVETVLHAHTQLAETWAKLSQVTIESVITPLQSTLRTLEPIYTEYVALFSVSARGYAQLSASNVPFAALMKRLTPQSSGLSLPSLMIMPIQRVPRYGLLLSTLLGKVEETDTTARMLVSDALHSAQTLAAAINEARRHADEMAELEECATRLKLHAQDDEELQEFVQQFRKLVKQGPLKKHARGGFLKRAHTRQFYLFNDCLVWAKPPPSNRFRGHVWLATTNEDDGSISKVTVRAVEADPKTQVQAGAAFQVAGNGLEAITLECPGGEDERTSWLAEFQHLLAHQDELLKRKQTMKRTAGGLGAHSLRRLNSEKNLRRLTAPEEEDDVDESVSVGSDSEYPDDELVEEEEEEEEQERAGTVDSEWIEKRDPESDVTYYVHSRTHEVSFDPPQGQEQQRTPRKISHYIKQALSSPTTLVERGALQHAPTAEGPIEWMLNRLEQQQHASISAPPRPEVPVASGHVRKHSFAVEDFLQRRPPREQIEQRREFQPSAAERKEVDDARLAAQERRQAAMALIDETSALIAEMRARERVQQQALLARLDEVLARFAS